MTISLIDKQDTFEMIRDRVAAILAAETQSQQDLADAEGKNPDLWKFRVYSERDNPWENLFGEDLTPIVNVSYDDSKYDISTSNMEDQQNATSRYNIDCYCHSESYQTTGGHAVGDELSANLAHNTAKLVRNIMMHGDYKYLLYPVLPEGGRLVWERWIQSITTFRPALSGGQPVEKVVACRVALDVKHGEEIPYEEPEILEIINVKFYYEPDGQVIAELEYPAS